MDKIEPPKLRRQTADIGYEIDLYHLNSITIRKYNLIIPDSIIDKFSFIQLNNITNEPNKYLLR